MTMNDRALFLARTAQTHEDHKRKAEAVGKVINYGLEQLRAVVEKSLLERGCCYCGLPLTVNNFLVSHKTPTIREGKWSLRNLVVCCKECDVVKGVLDETEFKEILLVIDAWPKPVRKNFLQRLRAGASVAKGFLPPPGSLEWFTGSDQIAASMP